MNLILEKLAENPSPRIPIMLIVDNSSSMIKDGRILKMNQGVIKLVDDFKQDELMAYSVELAIVGFKFDNKNKITRGVKIIDFDSLLNQEIPILKPFGKTPLGETVELGLDMLENRKNLYKQVGIQYYQPIMIILTDGESTDSVDRASKRTKNLIINKKLSVYPVGIGDQINLKELQKFVFKPLAKHIEVEDLPRLFQWIGESVSKITNSSFTLDTSDIEISWDRL